MSTGCDPREICIYLLLLLLLLLLSICIYLLLKKKFVENLIKTVAGCGQQVVGCQLYPCLYRVSVIISLVRAFITT
jgi:hypothetical protein